MLTQSSNPTPLRVPMILYVSRKTSVLGHFERLCVYSLTAAISKLQTTASAGDLSKRVQCVNRWGPTEVDAGSQSAADSICGRPMKSAFCNTAKS
jgi:hypothetical protein